jgi:hypothetical protein
MNRKVLVPATNEETAAIRKSPQKQVDFPTYSSQKWGIIIYSSMLLVVLVLYYMGTLINKFDWSFYLLLFLPLANSRNLFNLFGVLEDGILSGSNFIAWKRIKSFQFVPIDTSHKYYGYSKDVNNGYELIIKGKIFSESCIVTSNEMKLKLTKILNENVIKTEKCQK